MSYFDHIRCSTCNATLSPEAVGGRNGMNCPHCGNELRMADLFGLGDAFAEEEAPSMSLDDLVSANTGRSSAARSEPVKVEEGVSARELMRRMKKK